MLCIINNIECRLSELQQTQPLKKSTVALGSVGLGDE